MFILKRIIKRKIVFFTKKKKNRVYNVSVKYAKNSSDQSFIENL